MVTGTCFPVGEQRKDTVYMILRLCHSREMQMIRYSESNKNRMASIRTLPEHYG